MLRLIKMYNPGSTCFISWFSVNVYLPMCGCVEDGVCVFIFILGCVVVGLFTAYFCVGGWE